MRIKEIQALMSFLNLGSMSGNIRSSYDPNYKADLNTKADVIERLNEKLSKLHDQLRKTGKDYKKKQIKNKIIALKTRIYDVNKQ